VDDGYEYTTIHTVEVRPRYNMNTGYVHVRNIKCMCFESCRTIRLCVVIQHDSKY